MIMYKSLHQNVNIAPLKWLLPGYILKPWFREEKMQEIQSMCVPQNIKKVRNFWKSNLDSPVPTESPKVTKRSCSVDSADGSNKKYKPQLFPKPSLPKQVKDKALYIPLQFI